MTILISLFFQFQGKKKIGFYKLFLSLHSHPDSPHSHSDSPYFHPYSPHSPLYSPHSHPDIPHSQPDSLHSHSIPHILCILTLIPHIPIIPFIPFPNSPFQLLQNVLLNVYICAHSEKSVPLLPGDTIKCTLLAP